MAMKFLIYILSALVILSAIPVVRVGLGVHPRFVAVLFGIYGLASVATAVYLFFRPGTFAALWILLLLLMFQIGVALLMTSVVAKSINKKSVSRQSNSDET